MQATLIYILKAFMFFVLNLNACCGEINENNRLYGCHYGFQLQTSVTLKITLFKNAKLVGS